MVTVANVHGNQIVQFSQFSVLTGYCLASSEHVSRFLVLPGTAHTILAKACLGLLLRLSTASTREVSRCCPLCCRALGKPCTRRSLIDDGMESLLDGNKPYFAARLWVYDIDNPSGRHMTPTHTQRDHKRCGWRSVRTVMGVKNCPFRVLQR